MSAETSRRTESVWDYPRPPRVERDDRLVRIEHDGHVIASTRRAIRVLETSHPPVFYIDPSDVDLDYLAPSAHESYCEYKGRAVYWDVVVGDTRIENAAWSYPSPSDGYEQIAGWLAFYPSKVACSVDGIAVDAQKGGFYGGWITPEIVGPFKGGAGTAGW